MSEEPGDRAPTATLLAATRLRDDIGRTIAGLADPAAPLAAGGPGRRRGPPSQPRAARAAMKTGRQGRPLTSVEASPDSRIAGRRKARH
jgi:hypothetical protein